MSELDILEEPFSLRRARTLLRAVRDPDSPPDLLASIYEREPEIGAYAVCNPSCPSWLKLQIFMDGVSDDVRGQYYRVGFAKTPFVKLAFALEDAMWDFLDRTRYAQICREGADEGAKKFIDAVKAIQSESIQIERAYDERPSAARYVAQLRGLLNRILDAYELEYMLTDEDRKVPEYREYKKFLGFLLDETEKELQDRGALSERDIMRIRQVKAHLV